MQLKIDVKQLRTCGSILRGRIAIAFGSGLGQQQQERGEEDEVPVVVSALKACSSLKELEVGKHIHCDVTKSGWISDIFVANSLINMYAKCGSLVDSHKVFDNMGAHSVVSWNTLVLGYVENGDPETALDLFSQMQTQNFPPNARSFVAVAMACASLAGKESGQIVDGNLVKVQALKKATEIHSQVVKARLCANVFVANTLVDMHAKCGSMADAFRIFYGIIHPDVVSWTALMLGCIDNGHSDQALQLFSRMLDENCVPGARTFVAAFKACANLASQEAGKIVNGRLVKVSSLQKGMEIHAQAKNRGCVSDMFVASSLIDMYGKCGSLADAERVFNQMPQRDVVAWNAILLACVENGKSKLALDRFPSMQREGCRADSGTFVALLMACSSLASEEQGVQIGEKLIKVKALEMGMELHSQAVQAGISRDTFVANTLIDLYGRCGSMLDARRVFDTMQQQDRTLVSWNALLLGYVSAGDSEMVLDLYAEMKTSGYNPNPRTFVPLLMACSDLTALEAGQKIHAEIRARGIEHDEFVANNLVDFYGKCGNLADAKAVFDSISRSNRSLVTWTALITGYSQQGDTRQVIELFEKMEKQDGFLPDKVLFSSILAACSHGGFINEGLEFFQTMTSRYQIEADVGHYNCLIDLLGRADHLQQAMQILRQMPFKPTVVTWLTVLGACRKWKRVEIAKIAFKSLVELDGKNNAGYILMANIYGSLGMWDEQAQVLDMRRTALIG